MDILITRYHWLQLTNEQRALMRETFSIPRSGGVEMMNGKMTSDGSNERDLSSISVESMQKYIGSEETSFEKLFDLVVAKVNEIIKEKEQDKLLAEDRISAEERNKKMNELVSSLILTIENLPLDAQAKIWNHLENKFPKSIEKDPNVDTINNNKNENINVPIKKAGRPKKVEKGSNE